MRRVLRSPVATALVWCGFAAAAAWATEPVWGHLLFGFAPTIDDLIAVSARCLPAF